MRLLLVLLAFASTAFADDSALADLDGAGPIREWFEGAAGHARLIVFFSPT